MTLDYGFYSETFTRWSMLIETDVKLFFEDVFELFDEEILDWFLIGEVFGLLWREWWDVKLPE